MLQENEYRVTVHGNKCNFLIAVGRNIFRKQSRQTTFFKRKNKKKARIGRCVRPKKRRKTQQQSDNIPSFVPAHKDDAETVSSVTVCSDIKNSNLQRGLKHSQNLVKSLKDKTKNDEKTIEKLKKEVKQLNKNIYQEKKYQMI